MARSYRVKELFYSLQGEGAHSGRPAVFLRFAGCNLWSGRPEDRAASRCPFCDTDFVGGERYGNAADLAAAVAALWPGGGRPYVVCTGGEPALQLDSGLITALKERGFQVAVESNGTLPLPDGLDWICISPKASAPLCVTSGDELKLVWPQTGLNPQDFLALSFGAFYLQPMDGPQQAQSLRQCVEYCQAHPDWHLSLQTHKIIGIP